MAKRGRPKKKADDLNEEKFEEQSETNETIEEATETQEEEIKEEQPQTEQADSNVVGEGTFNDHNPFAESVIERDYSTPKVASGVVEDIDEPQFVPPSYDDIVNDNMGGEEMPQEETGSPFDNPNPALNELDNKDKKIACESLVDTFLDGYEQLHKYAQYVIKVDEDELLQLHQADKIDLNERIPVDENGNEMSVSEFVAQYNEQGVQALQYDQEFGYKVRPAMVRVFMKKGWGMSDEQFLIYHFGKDIAIKIGIMYQLKKTINTTLQTLQKAHKRNKGMGSGGGEASFTQQAEEEVYEDDDFDYENEAIDVEEQERGKDEPLTPLTPEQDFEDKTDDYNKNLHINMPDKKKPTILPKEVRDEIQKPKKKKKDDKDQD